MKKLLFFFIFLIYSMIVFYFHISLSYIYQFLYRCYFKWVLLNKTLNYFLDRINLEKCLIFYETNFYY